MRAKRNARLVIRLRTADPKRVCPKCGAAIGESCFRISAGGEYRIRLKNSHKERK